MEPFLEQGELRWRDCQQVSLDRDIVRPVAEPFDDEGGIRLVEGNVGRAIVKVSAVDPDHRAIEAPARVFHSQEAFTEAFNRGELETDFVAVLAYQGPRANGMPELHKLTPYLGVLQNQGFRVALLTDGRMSGASGKVLAAIQVSPEAARGGLIGKIRDGDRITIDSAGGTLSVAAEDDVAAREAPAADLAPNHVGMGREMFSAFRTQAGVAEAGASIFGVEA